MALRIRAVMTRLRSALRTRFRAHEMRDTVEARALEGHDWGADAQPKRTEFESLADALAMTSPEWDVVV